MTPDEVRQRVEQIRDMIGDDEGAHVAEKALWRDVLQDIADGIREPELLASIALLTSELDFSRWYA